MCSGDLQGGLVAYLAILCVLVRMADACCLLVLYLSSVAKVIAIGQINTFGAGDIQTGVVWWAVQCCADEAKVSQGFRPYDHFVFLFASTSLFGGCA